MKIDPYKSKEKYTNWNARTQQGIPGIPQESSTLIKRFLRDWELGLNISNGARKGPRSYLRLNTIRARLTFLARTIHQRFHKTLAEVSEEQLHELFAAMRHGDIRNRFGANYRSTGDYVKVFRCFWRWHMKIERKLGRNIQDICLVSCNKS